MIAPPPMTRILDAAKAIHAATPALQAFQPWPEDLQWSARAPVAQPVSAEIATHCPGCCPASQPLADALPDVFDVAEWRVTYSEDQVGRDFIERYGYFELYGPTGMYHSAQARAYVGYWGRGLHYARHWHEAEELYYVCGGSAHFEAEGMPDRLLGPGDWQEHASNQPHALTTRDEPLLTLVLWRGKGMGGLPFMPVGSR